MADDRPPLLPDVPGKVHGIVQVDPFVRVQCDGCGYIHAGEPGNAPYAVQFSGIQFSPRRYRCATNPDQRRLCRTCRETEWGERS